MNERNKYKPLGQYKSTERLELKMNIFYIVWQF